MPWQWGNVATLGRRGNLLDPYDGARETATIGRGGIFIPEDTYCLTLDQKTAITLSLKNNSALIISLKSENCGEL